MSISKSNSSNLCATRHFEHACYQHDGLPLLIYCHIDVVVSVQRSVPVTLGMSPLQEQV